MGYIMTEGMREEQICEFTPLECVSRERELQAVKDSAATRGAPCYIRQAFPAKIERHGKGAERLMHCAAGAPHALTDRSVRAWNTGTILANASLPHTRSPSNIPRNMVINHCLRHTAKQRHVCPKTMNAQRQWSAFARSPAATAQQFASLFSSEGRKRQFCTRRCSGTARHAASTEGA